MSKEIKQTNGKVPSTQESIDTLSSLLESLRTGTEDPITQASNGAEDDFDPSALPALLKKLDQADLAADGLENRLDSLLSELDELLEGLEGQQQAKADSHDNEKDKEVSPAW